jgi:hypothetical protein
MEPIMANKTKAKKTPKQPIFSDTLRALISSASVIGFVVADSFGEALTLVESIITETKGKVALRDKALNAAQANYVPGYVARSLLRLPDYRTQRQRRPSRKSGGPTMSTRPAARLMSHGAR